MEVNNNLQEEAANSENAEIVSRPGELDQKIKQAILTQNIFWYVVRRAEERGMKVNSARTGMLYVSDSFNYSTSAYILDRDGNKIESGSKLKVLGFHFSSRPTVEAHVEVIKRHFRARYWVLHHLCHNSFSTEDLVKVYSTIRSQASR